MWFQHGDVTIFPITEIPDSVMAELPSDVAQAIRSAAGQLPGNAKEMAREGGRIVLRRGEQTGHAHVITSEAATAYHIGNIVFIVADDSVGVQHEEHDVGTLVADTHLVWRLAEYDHFAEEARQVRD